MQLLVGYRDGRPVRRNLCLACAVAAPQLLRPLIPSRHLRLDAALVLAGVLVCVLGLVRDLLSTSVGGFGWHQMLGVSVGALVLVLGLLTRVDFLAAGGVVVLGIAGAADLLLRSGSAGIGWKQELLIAFGLAMILAGLRLTRIRRRAAPQTVTVPLFTCATSGFGSGGLERGIHNDVTCFTETSCSHFENDWMPPWARALALHVARRPDLATLIRVWDRLTDAGRAAVLAVAQATVDADRSRDVD